ncbi:uncharacterized protein SOCEGT47_019890 [Sorangium cellulosum]|uniref:Response regulatory domain-containing protein n=1 Tax=Sorangium cellulosum TaxID=56 RepID=A0A4P2PYA5_SORCE|nr:response regulator [Sorangium cellulosum]AUX21503.1 uncharacterized protein SOCEGT47_019890 [Sorangium cellulosum]
MKPHVLIVDGSLTIRMDLRGLLRGAGFVVTACETRALAQKVLRSKPFSLVILDALLPDGDGIELLREIRAGAEHVPVILLSTEAEVRHRLQVLGVGADEHVEKPYDGGALVLRATELASQHGAALRSSGGGTSAVTGKRILVVDDSPTYRATVVQLLRQDGCDVVPAQSGDEALSLLAVERVDGVIIDLLMPGMGGLETARRIKSADALRHIPVVILTGHDDADTRAEGARIGVDDFVLKTPEIAMLRTRLRGLFRSRVVLGAEGGAPTRGAGSSSPPDGASTRGAGSSSPPDGATSRRAGSSSPPDGATSRRTGSSSPPDGATSRRTGSSSPPDGASSRRTGSSLDEVPSSQHAGSGPGSAAPPAAGSLFDQVVAASGLSSVIGPSTIIRACLRAGIEPRSMSPEDLHRALPAIHETLRLFLTEEDSNRGIAAISQLARAAAPAAG